MPRPRRRICLEEGLRLNLTLLMHWGFLRPGFITGPKFINWTHSYTGEEIASGEITGLMQAGYNGWVHIKIGNFEQLINVVSQPRHFGGWQCYFECPSTHRRCSVLWMPRGANRFCSRQTWNGQVAYASQFADRDGRAHIGKERIKSRLIADLNPHEWDLPPKPKWMRWHTYNRCVEKFDRYEELLDLGLVAAANRLSKMSWS
jgi:hypothetical protein